MISIPESYVKIFQVIYLLFIIIMQKITEKILNKIYFKYENNTAIQKRKGVSITEQT